MRAWPPSPPVSSATSPPDHSLEVEHRLTETEVGLAHHVDRQREWNTRTDGRISHLEMLMRGVIWAISLLATSKSGELADVAVGLLKRGL